MIRNIYILLLLSLLTPSWGQDCDCDNGAIMDCAGECGGSAIIDECGVCGGDNSTCTDCFGYVNGEAWINACGECVPLSDTSCLIDCADTPNGDAVEDNCGTCDNNVSNDCTMDCNGVWGGGVEFDACGVCVVVHNKGVMPPCIPEFDGEGNVTNGCWACCLSDGSCETWLSNYSCWDFWLSAPGEYLVGQTCDDNPCG